MAETVSETVTRCDQRRVVMLKPFVCLKCCQPMGMTDGKRLILGKVSLLGAAALKCECGAIRVWRPVKGRGNDD